MKSYANKKQKSSLRSLSNSTAQKPSKKEGFYIEDNRSELTQLKVDSNSDISHLVNQKPGTVQRKEVIQLAKASGRFGNDVTGENELVDVFDELMANAQFRNEFQTDYLDRLPNRKFLNLQFNNGSLFSRANRRIYINIAYQGDKEKIRHDLAFELHNATAIQTMDDLDQANSVPANNRSNIEKIKHARIAEYTEWLNILKLGSKHEQPNGGNMGFQEEPTLVSNAKTDFNTFSSYLNFQLSRGHTQHYLQNVHSELEGNASLDLSQKDATYYKKQIPQLFVVQSNEKETYDDVMQNMQGGSNLKRIIDRANHVEKTIQELYSKFQGTEKESIANSMIREIEFLFKESDLSNTKTFIGLNIKLLNLKNTIEEKVEKKFQDQNSLPILAYIMSRLF